MPVRVLSRFVPHPVTVVALTALLVAPPVFASDAERPLIGLWLLQSWHVESKDTGEKRTPFGAKPKGYAVFTPEKRVVSIHGREPSQAPDGRGAGRGLPVHVVTGGRLPC